MFFSIFKFRGLFPIIRNNKPTGTITVRKIPSNTIGFTIFAAIIPNLAHKRFGHLSIPGRKHPKKIKTRPTVVATT